MSVQAEGEWLALAFEDAGPRGWNAGNTLTAREFGQVRADRLLGLPGRKGEHELFARSATGRKSPAEWSKLVSSIKRSGVKETVILHRERDLVVWIYEGNHRVRAAFAAGRLVPVEISYFGNSQRQGYLFPDLPRVTAPKNP